MTEGIVVKFRTVMKAITPGGHGRGYVTS